MDPHGGEALIASLAPLLAIPVIIGYVVAGLIWSEVTRGTETDRAGRRLMWMVVLPLFICYLLK